MDFMQQFLEGYQTGLSTLARKRQLEYEKEDREIEKQLLQHRLRELKIQERVQARQAAAQNLDFMSGIDENEIPESMTELKPYGGSERRVDPNALASIPGSITPGDYDQRTIREIELPGIEEFGVPSVKRRPETLQQQLANQFIRLRMQALGTPRELSAGETAVLPLTGEVLGRGEPRFERPIIRTVRDAKGNEIDIAIDPRTLTPISDKPVATRAPRPQRPSTTVVLGQENEEEIADMIIRGDRPPKLPQTAQGLRIEALLGKRGFNLRAASQDYEIALARAKKTDSAARQAMIDAANQAESALTELEAVSEEWGSSGFGSGIALSMLKMAGSQEQKELANRYETAVKNAQAAVARVQAGGRAPTNKLLEDAAKQLDPSKSHASLKAVISQLKKSLPVRTSAIRSAVTDAGDSGAGDSGGGTTDSVKYTDEQIRAALDKAGYDSSPESVAKVRNNPAALQELFGK